MLFASYSVLACISNVFVVPSYAGYSDDVLQCARKLFTLVPKMLLDCLAPQLSGCARCTRP